MRTALLALLTAVLLASVGCHHNLAKNGCQGGCDECGDCAQGSHVKSGSFADKVFGRSHGGGMGHGGGHPGHAAGAAAHPGSLYGFNAHGTAAGAYPQGPTRVAPLPRGYVDQQTSAMNGGPAGPTYAYPYYTIRGPRDFLMDNPPSIGY